MASEKSRVLLGKDLEHHAALLFIDPVTEAHLMYLVPKFMRAPLPDGWTVGSDRCGGKLYRNESADRVSQYHPLSYYFAAVAQRERISGKEPGPSLRMDSDGHVVIDLDVADYLLKDPATLQDVRIAMEYLGISDDDSEVLLRLAMQYYLAPLPPGWHRIQMPDSSVQFFNIDTGEKSEKGPMFNLFFEKASAIRKCASETQQPVSETRNGTESECETSQERKLMHAASVPEDAATDAHSAYQAGNYTREEPVLLSKASTNDDNRNSSSADIFLERLDHHGCQPNCHTEAKHLSKGPDDTEATGGIELQSYGSSITVWDSSSSPPDHLCGKNLSKDSVEPVIQSVQSDNVSEQDTNLKSEHIYPKKEPAIFSVSSDVYNKQCDRMSSNVPIILEHVNSRPGEDIIIHTHVLEDPVKCVSDHEKSATIVALDRNPPDVVSDVVDRKTCEETAVETASFDELQRQSCAWYISGYKKANALLASRACYLLMDAVLKATHNT